MFDITRPGMSNMSRDSHSPYVRGNYFRDDPSKRSFAVALQNSGEQITVAKAWKVYTLLVNCMM